MDLRQNIANIKAYDGETPVIAKLRYTSKYRDPTQPPATTGRGASTSTGGGDGDTMVWSCPPKWARMIIIPTNIQYESGCRTALHAPFS
jgi:hypothetical protein